MNRITFSSCENKNHYNNYWLYKYRLPQNNFHFDYYSCYHYCMISLRMTSHYHPYFRYFQASTDTFRNQTFRLYLLYSQPHFHFLIPHYLHLFLFLPHRFYPSLDYNTNHLQDTVKLMN